MKLHLGELLKLNEYIFVCPHVVVRGERTHSQETDRTRCPLHMEKMRCDCLQKKKKRTLLFIGAQAAEDTSEAAPHHCKSVL